eukprot:scaffold6580_cov29-Tisochrysis_lutea.AAC.6
MGLWYGSTEGPVQWIDMCGDAFWTGLQTWCIGKGRGNENDRRSPRLPCACGAVARPARRPHVLVPARRRDAELVTAPHTATRADGPPPSRRRRRVPGGCEYRHNRRTHRLQ